MAQFKAIDPKAEVRGEIVESLIAVMGAFKAIALGILADNGIENLHPHHWYPQQAFLSSFETIANKVGPNTLYQIGRRIPEQAYYPPGLDTIDKVFAALDENYQTCHRGGEVGSYRFYFTGMSSGILECHTAYPCDFDRGLVESLGQRFEPKDSFVTVEHDNLAPCKKSRGDSCTYNIRW